MSDVRLVVVADDLTGAADSAARAWQAGLFAVVEVAGRGLPAAVDADALAVTTDSRFLPPAEAAACVTAVAQRLAAVAPTAAVWYKKIDSTLRGNVGAEVMALLAARDMAGAVICPAFPAQDRGLEGGYLVYGSVPPQRVHLPTLLAEQTGAAVAAIGLATVRLGVGALRKALAAQRKAGAQRAPQLLVVDAMSEADLKTIVAAVAAARSEGLLLCGSAGMVAPLAALLCTELAAPAAPPTLSPGPTLLVVGSGSAMAHRQIAQVAARAAARVRVLDAAWYTLDVLGAQCHPVGDWLLHLPAPAAGVPLEGSAARLAAARLAEAAWGVVQRMQPTALVVVGGDTAQALLHRLGITRLTVAAELLPGIPLTLGEDRGGLRRAVALKPGNFGDAQTLVTLLTRLHGLQTA